VPLTVSSGKLVVTINPAPATTKNTTPVKQGTAPVITVAAFNGVTPVTVTKTMDVFFTSTSINIVQQICSLVVPNGPFDVETNGIKPFVLTNTAVKNERDAWSLTITNNVEKDVTFTNWYVVCNNVESDKFNTTFTFTPTPLATGTAPSAMTGTYYSNAASPITFSGNAWFANLAVNTGVKCTFTPDTKANGNISFQQASTPTSLMFTVKNQATAFASTANKLSCTSDQQKTAVDVTFSYTWTGCAVATLQASVTAGNGAAYTSFQGVKGTASHSIGDISKVFFVNQNCPTVSGVQGVQATPAAASDCKASSTQITASGQTLNVITNLAAAPTTAGVNFVNGVKYGYSSSITTKLCQHCSYQKHYCRRYGISGHQSSPESVRRLR